MDTLNINNSLQWVICRTELKKTIDTGEKALTDFDANDPKANLIFDELCKHQIPIDERNYIYSLVDVKKIGFNYKTYEDEHFYVEGFEIGSKESGVIGHIDCIEQFEIEYLNGETFEVIFNGVIDNDRGRKRIIQRSRWESFYCRDLWR